MTTLIKLNHLNNSKIKTLNTDIEKMTVERNNLIRTGVENTLKAIIYITNIDTISINFINNWPEPPMIDIGLKINNELVEICDGEVVDKDISKISINKNSPLAVTDVLHTLLNVYFILDSYYSCFLPEDEDTYTLIFNEDGLVTK